MQEDADSFLVESDDMDESAGPSRSSRGKKKQKKTKAPADIKPNLADVSARLPRKPL